MMNKLVSDCGNNNGNGNNSNRRKKWMTRSNNSQFFFDSETDTDDGGVGGGGSGSGRKHSGERAKRRMSQSLTHSVSVTDDTEKSSADVNSAAVASNNGANLAVPNSNSNDVVLTHSTEFTVDKSVDPSSSSVDPSSSSAGGNTTGNESSVAPSSSSDGSLMKNTVDYVKLAEERAATIAALERRLGDLEAALSGSGGAVPGIRRELSALRQTVVEERGAFDGFVAGLMQAVADGGRGVGKEVDK